MSDRKSLLKKRRRHSIIGFEMIRLDRSAAEPLHEQLYRQIRDELRSASFNEGASRLPSSRSLAVDLGISRLTVSLAFSKLYAEGYLRSKARSGTFVADPLPEIFLTADKAKPCRSVPNQLRISGRVKAIPDQRAGKQFDLGALEAGAGLSLVPGLPAVDEFPIDTCTKGRPFTAPRIQPWRCGFAQSSCELPVRFQRRTVSSRSNPDRWGNAAGDANQRHGAAESGRSGVD